MAELMESNDLVLVDNVRKKKSKKGKVEEVEEPMRPGIVYVGHIPHGFYEKEMEGFFSQFGEVKRIKVSRNKKVWLKLKCSFHDGLKKNWPVDYRTSK